MMRGDKMVAFWAGVVILLLGLHAWSSGFVGLPGSMLEQDARQTQQIPTDWLVAMDCGDSVAGLLFYPPDESDFVCVVYVNDSASLGYRFRAGGKFIGIETEVGQFRCQDGSSLLFSMNTPSVARVELDNGQELHTIIVDPARPFVIVLPNSAGRVTLFDIEHVPISISASQLG